MNQRLQEALADCTKAIVAEKVSDAFAIITSLVTCYHGHHFVVINQGMSIITTADGLACLRERGVQV